MAAGYTPDAADIVRISFDSRADHKQSGHLRAVVLSPLASPFGVRLSGQPARAALADQVKSLDWGVRKAARKAQATTAEMAEIRSKLRALIG